MIRLGIEKVEIFQILLCWKKLTVKVLIIQMKVLSQNILMVLFVLLLKRVHIFLIFQINLYGERWQCKVYHTSISLSLH